MGFKGTFFKGLLIALSLALIPVTAVSAQKVTAGSACKTVNQKATYLNKTYTCVKSGKKLVWNKGVAVKKPTPQPTPTAIGDPEGAIGGTPTPTPTPMPTPTPTPTVKPWVPPTAPTSFSDVVAQADGIAYWAWKKAAQKIDSSAPKLGVIEILMGPYVVINNPTPLVALNLVSRLSANYEEPKKVVVIYAGEKDIEWGQKQVDEFCIGRSCGYDVGGEAKKACNIPLTPCWGGFALRNQRTNTPLIYMTASEWGKTDRSHTSGTLEAHEYFHTIQDLLLANGSLDVIPRWFTEGSASWVQRATIYSGDFNKYENERRLDNNETLSRNKPTAAWLEKFLDPDYTTGWDKWNGNEYDPWAIYDVGSLATEVMVAIGGPDKFLDLFKITGSGKSFAQAFESIYGVSWRDGAKIIAQAIVAQQK